MSKTTVVYKIIDNQSGEVRYTAYETESDPFDYFRVEEVALEDVPQWALPEVNAELTWVRLVDPAMILRCCPLR